MDFADAAPLGLLDKKSSDPFSSLISDGRSCQRIPTKGRQMNQPLFRTALLPRSRKRADSDGHAAEQKDPTSFAGLTVCTHNSSMMGGQVRVVSK
jgi:hypothetical protein